MTVWKLSIKPEKKYAKEAFEVCKKRKLVAIGWSKIFNDKQITSKEDSYEALSKDINGLRTVKKFLEEVKSDDLFWLHQEGSYYLCRISSGLSILGPNITDKFLDYDLGHAREAQWVCVPEDMVPGRVQRAVIVSRTLQRIHCSLQEETAFNKIHYELIRDSNWQPDLDIEKIINFVQDTPREKLNEIFSPDDHEDIIAAYLQCQGWILVKSTCFRSKSQFEFRMVKKDESGNDSHVAYVQVKSGQTHLDINQYRASARDGTIYLYSTACHPYSGEKAEGIIPIDPSDVFKWLCNNIWFISKALRIKIQIYIDSQQQQLKYNG